MFNIMHFLVLFLLHYQLSLFLVPHFTYVVKLQGQFLRVCVYVCACVYGQEHQQSGGRRLISQRCSSGAAITESGLG